MSWITSICYVEQMTIKTLTYSCLAVLLFTCTVRDEWSMIESTMNEYYAAFHDKGYQRLYSQLTAEQFKSTVTFVEYEAANKEFTSLFGGLIEKRAVKWSKWIGPSGGLFYGIEYLVQYANGNSTESFSLIEVDGTYRIHDYRIDSPLLEGSSFFKSSPSDSSKK